jgi:hypothetical protein
LATVLAAVLLPVVWATLERVVELMIEESLRADFGRGSCALFEAALGVELWTAFHTASAGGVESTADIALPAAVGKES